MLKYQGLEEESLGLCVACSGWIKRKRGGGASANVEEEMIRSRKRRTKGAQGWWGRAEEERVGGLEERANRRLLVTAVTLNLLAL